MFPIIVSYILLYLPVGENNFIGIGVCDKTYPPHLLPGLKETSIALHTKDGSIFFAPNDPEPLDLPCRRGCVIKCLVVPDPQDNTSTIVEFFKDGERVKAVSTCVPEGGLYGMVGMMSRGEKIQISSPVITSRLGFSRVWEVCTPDFIQHHRDGLCSYVGPGYLNEESIGTVRTKQKIDPLGPLSNRCFEIRIVDPGEKMYIAIGICSQTYPSNMLPGWKEMSVGYHADNGCLFYNSDNGQPTHHQCKKGDTMRCTVQPVDGSQKQVLVVFHHNNQLVGKLTAWAPENGFYGSFGMMSKGECVQVALPDITEPYIVPKANFLSVWEAITPNLEYNENGIFSYVGEGGTDSVGTVRSKSPIDPLSPNNTFEVKIVNPGDKCYIALGVCSPRYPPMQLPGWTEISVGFHADNGLILNGVGDEQIDTKCNCIKGDVIRCTVEPVDGSNKQINVIFHRNTVLIGKVLLWNPKDGLYAQVGSMSKGEVIQIASPQTVPSSLTHNAPDRSVSVPTDQVVRETMKRKQISERHDPSRMTPAPKGASDPAPFSEHAPVDQHPLRQYDLKPAGYPVNVPEDPHKANQNHNQASATASDSAYWSQINVESHEDSRSHAASGSHAHGTLPATSGYQPQDLSSTSSQKPFPIQPTPAGYPVNVPEDPHKANQNPNQASATASDSAYWSQINVESHEDSRSHAASGSHAHGTLPATSGCQSQELSSTLSQKPFPIQRTPVKPHVVPDKSSPTGGSYPQTAANKGFDYPDSPATIKGGLEEHFPQGQTRLKSVHEFVCEPVKSFDVSAGQPPPIQLLTKKENTFYRILHNTSCDENGTLQCTLPTDSTGTSFAMRRLQLTEKIPYFEVELEEYNDVQNVVVGIVPKHHPYTVPIGSLPHTIAYHTATGSLVRGGKESRSITEPCSVGDVVGCRVEWTYKLEAKQVKPTKMPDTSYKPAFGVNSAGDEPSSVKVEWFHNGCSFATESLNVPASGFYPAIGMTSIGTVVKVRYIMNLKPDSFFDSHPLPDNFRNIEVPNCATEGWNCFQNAQIDENDCVMFQDESASLPTIVQNHTPFTTVKPYFEVELQYPISSYSILSVGALEKISNPKEVIPGESHNSIGVFPLLGFVMRNNSISATLPPIIEAEMKNTSEKIRIGVGVDFHQKIPCYSSITRRVKVFFTINCQLINSTYATISPSGIYPTIAVGSDFRKLGDKLVQLQFSHPRPQVSTLPLGFARAPPNSFKKTKIGTVAAENILPEGSDTPQALQAALPFSLSHTYFELRIARCHETRVFSCGVTPYTSSLTYHPGDSKNSVGFFPSEGSVHQNGLESSIVCSPCSYEGARIGCGARFPSDGSSKYMEVFFTLNGSMIARRLVSVPEPGLFPTVGFYTKGRGIVSVDAYAEDPFPDLQFSTTWRELRNMKAEGALLQSTSLSEPCMAQLVHAVSIDKPSYFTIMPEAHIDARILMGFSNHTTCFLLDDHPSPLPTEGDDKSDTEEETVPVEEGWRGCIVDVVTGKALVQDKLCSIQSFSLEQSHQYGCGTEPIKNSSYHLFFFTIDDQVVFCKRFCLAGESMFPTIFVCGPTARVSIDACALWPLQNAIGTGWARVKHLVLKKSKISHVATDQRAKIPVGFAQAAMPIIPSSSYFEVEVCSRSVDKAIAVGLASRAYPSNTWVGWKSTSVAYHLDDGNLFTGSGMFSHKIGPKVFQGHTVGCGVIPKSSDSETREGQKVEVFFTVNGAVIVEQKITVPKGGFYPTLCLESPTESLIFHRYSRFPPVQNIMGSNWGSCYLVHRAGVVLEHSSKHKELPLKGPSRGFCQASWSFSPEKSYFEIEIMGVTDVSCIQVGAAVEIPLGCRTANVDSVMYSCSGQVNVRVGSQSSNTGTQRCGSVGNIVGCGLNFTDNHPTSIEFYLNNMKLLKASLSENWKGRPLFPTIILSQPGNTVVPRMSLSPPQWDRSSLIGWLRTERVTVSGSIAEYHPSGAEKPEIGFCQINHCLESNLNSSFEVEILNHGKSCAIGVGAASANYSALCMPGWKENSIAYHGDDGHLFASNPYGVPFGPTWRDRDIIGVTVRQPNFESTEEHEIQVYFTKNGLVMGHATITIPPSGLFPTVGFHSPREKVKITLNPSGLGNFNPSLLQWRSMYGMKLQSTPREKQCVLQYCENGRKMHSNGTKIALAVYGDPFSEKLQYFEIDLLSMGEDTIIGIGVVPKKYPLDLAPGWGKKSMGYHIDSGQLFQARDRGKYFGPIAKKGDTIGCGINFIPNNLHQCSVYFTYNGVEIGRARASIPSSGLYPSLCLMQKYDKVRVTMLETFKPKILIPELHMVGLMRISNCAYSDQIVQFTGTSISQVGSTPGIAQFAVPMHKDRNYFAAHILKADDSIAIGLAVRDYPLRYIPGSTSISMAYDITKGSIRAVYDSENFHRYDGEELKCGVGDRVGCGVVSSDSKSKPSFVYFTRNGRVVKKIQFDDIFEDLYPVVGFAPNQRSSLLFMDWNMPLFDSSNLLCDC